MTIGANQKTTVSAAISAAAAFVMFASQPPFSIHFPTWVTAMAMFLMVGGLASLGVNAKDSNVTGGSVVQPGIAVADPATVARLAAPPTLTATMYATPLNLAPAPRPAQPLTGGLPAIKW